MGFRRHVAMPAVLMTVAVMAAAAPAQATVFDQGYFTFEESNTEDLCGLEVRHDFAINGHFRTRTGKRDLDQAFFGKLSAHITDTFTNLATEAFFTVEARLTEMDLKATPLGGDLFEFEFREAGMGVVRDMDGDVVLRDRGVIWMRQVFDTLGDSQPGGNILDESVIRVSGPHPGFEQDDETFCAAVHELIG